MLRSNLITKRARILLTFICLFITTISLDLSYAWEETNKFVDPSIVFEMPEDWVKKPIKYESWAEGADIAITLDQGLYPALVDMIQDYAQKNNLVIKVNEGTCGISAGMIKDKSVDISAYCCPVGESDRLPGMRFHTVGVTPLRILVHKDNPIENVTTQEARDLFSGDITKWSGIKTLSGEAGPELFVQPIGRLHCKTRPGHWRLILDNEDLFSLNLQDVGSISEMIYAVAANKGAIGYEVEWMVKRYKSEDKVKCLHIDGHDPDDPSSLLSVDYPFYRTYVLSTWKGKELENPKVKKLVDYILNNFKDIGSKYDIIDSSLLRDKGWKFVDDELVGEPEK